MQFDAIGVFLTGSKISDVRLALGLLPAGERPLLFCGFNGVVLEKFIEGMSWRLGYDLICLNGPRDRDAMLERMVSTTPFRRQPHRAHRPAAQQTGLASQPRQRIAPGSWCLRNRW